METETVYQDEAGEDKTKHRWHWRSPKAESPLADPHFGFSNIGFPNEALAKADLAQHLAAKPDGTGRLIRPVEQIEKLIEIGSELCGDCKGTKPAKVVSRESDAAGCNWEVLWRPTDKGNACDCRLRGKGVAYTLSTTYNIPGAS